jgi:acyl-CoA synthetase (NDP forming)
VLEPFYCPTSVAVVGASQDETKLGHAVLKNLLECGYEGKVYAINPRGGEILGVQAYPSIQAIPGEVELVVSLSPSVSWLPCSRNVVKRESKGWWSSPPVSARWAERG